MTNKPKRGGPRAGSGAKPLSATEPTVLLTAKVTPTEKAMFKAIGGSKWLHRAILQEFTRFKAGLKAERIDAIEQRAAAQIAQDEAPGAVAIIDPKVTARRVNVAIDALGCAERIQRGPGGGCYYWHGGRADDMPDNWPPEYVNDPGQLTIGQWLAIHAENAAKGKP